ncbi:MAG: hypothetical protein M3N47_09075 [Chloroflexota bacterium]|nr:hypothetical protein [Chloroflexota bacterium]
MSADYGDHLVRSVERDSRRLEIKVQQRRGEWGELVEIDDDSVWLASPGARRVTIAEYVGPDARRIQRLGVWVEIPADVARSDVALLRWCRRNANSELPSGAFRLTSRDWERRGGDELDLPFLPEFDHAEDVIRQLAAVEAKHRDLDLRLRRVADLRRKAIAAATSNGHSRRSLGRLIGLSYARIQQLLADR